MTVTSGSRSAPSTVNLRVLHDGAKPIHDTGEPYAFGLQCGRDGLLEGSAIAGGRVAFDLTLNVKPGPDPERPVFTGEFADGPPGARFLRLGWKPDRPGWINRVKVPLTDITWAQVRAAQSAGRPLIADATGRMPHQPLPLAWTVAP